MLSCESFCQKRETLYVNTIFKEIIPNRPYTQLSPTTISIRFRPAFELFVQAFDAVAGPQRDAFFRRVAILARAEPRRSHVSHHP
jgi:hypothetical protein